MLRHEAAVATADCWDVKARDPNKAEADRALTSALLSRGRCGTTSKHTLNYTAGSNALSVDTEYFRRNNTVDRWRFGERPTIYLFHMSQQVTSRFFACRYDDHRSYTLDELNMSQCRELCRRYNVINGFECQPDIPQGATVLVHMCIPQELPLKFLTERTDLHRILYTAESPNKNHRLQWEQKFLASIADLVLTYWKPLLQANTPFVTHLCPHNCHHLDDLNEHDKKQFRKNTGGAGTVCMVLENRPGLEMFEIDGVRLQCLDGLRASWARKLGELGLQVTVHGRGWVPNGPWVVGGTAGKTTDTSHAVDILQKHTAALIVENSDGAGYVSEKLYDALMAGAVPIFYNGNKTLGLPVDMHFNLATDDPSDITASSIAAKAEHLLRLRAGILRSVGSQAYADTVSQVLPG